MNSQLELTSLFDEREIPTKSGAAEIRVLDSSSILSPAQGFMGDYDFTLNPYIGCQFGCAYCYAAFFVNSPERRETWGQWVDVKQSAVAQLRRRRAMRGKRIYMSSVTDPYQPIEAKIELTREIVEVLSAEERQPRLVVQTRSPLVTRDIDLFKRFAHLRVNMTITTDSEDVRKRFEPLCPSNERRMEAIREAKASGLRVCICITPMLPLEDPTRFSQDLAKIGADIYVAQPFKPSGGRFAACTREMAMDIVKEYNWTESNYRAAFTELRRHLPMLYEGREGFMPE